MNHELAMRAKEEALTFLKNAMKSGEHIGAGLRITLQVGGGEAPKQATFDVSSTTGEVLGTLYKAVCADRELQILMAKSEYKELGEFLQRVGGAK
jgi:hypothetical protein